MYIVKVFLSSGLRSKKYTAFFRFDYVNLNIYFPLFEVQDRYLLDFIYHLSNQHFTFLGFINGLEKLQECLLWFSCKHFYLKNWSFDQGFTVSTLYYTLPKFYLPTYSLSYTCVLIDNQQVSATCSTMSASSCVWADCWPDGSRRMSVSRSRVTPWTPPARPSMASPHSADPQ